MKKIFILAVVSALFSIKALAQQEPMHTQFMFNKLHYNPGYAGSFTSPTLTTIYRQQWIGFEGAPNFQGITYTKPFINNHLGTGINLNRYAIGITKVVTVAPSIAYQIALPRGYLGMGFQFQLRRYQQNWQDDRLITPQPGVPDNNIPLDNGSKFSPNIDFGAYYSAHNWYLGIAAQHLYNANIDQAESGNVFSEQFRHLNAMFGITFDVSEDIAITPQAMVKYVKHAPVDVDVNVSALFMNKFHTGLTYRTGGNPNNLGESIDVLAGIQATKNLMIMLSYDVGMTKVSSGTYNSIEATLRWWFNPPEGTQVVDPNRPDEGVKY